MVKVELAIDGTPMGELTVSSYEEGVAIIEALGDNGQFITFEGFEKGEEEYEWYCTSQDFIGNIFELTLEVKD